jgi:GT2 family glycosyltransferase
MSDASPALSVIIVSWNVCDLTLDCLTSVEAERARVPMQIILVDNASRDDTVSMVRARFPGVEIVTNTENVGFPRANNQGLERARGRHVLFLNPDTVVGAGALAECVAALDADPSIGMVGCRLLYPDGRLQYECARNPYMLRHLLAETLHLHMLLPQSPVFGHHLMGDWDHQDTRDVEAISGAFMMVRANVALELGGLPEDVFMYHEDLSFCLRVRRAGWRLRYLSDVWTIHVVQQSAQRSRARLDLLEGESKLQLIRELQGPAYAAAARGVFAVRSLLRLIVSLVAYPIPGLAAKARHPRMFHISRHFLQLVWSLFPRWTRPLIPGPPTRRTAS